MVHRTRVLLVILAASAAATLWFQRAASNADDTIRGSDQAAEKEKPHAKNPALKAFMRKKLESAQSVLEGLAIEDCDLIARGARQLKATSAAAEFRVSNDRLYAEETVDFGKIVDKLAKAAKEKRLDGATLAYMDMTMSCVECHKYVRNVLVAE